MAGRNVQALRDLLARQSWRYRTMAQAYTSDQQCAIVEALLDSLHVRSREHGELPRKALRLRRVELQSEVKRRLGSGYGSFWTMLLIKLVIMLFNHFLFSGKSEYARKRASDALTGFFHARSVKEST
jgi:hypothetical protein